VLNSLSNIIEVTVPEMAGQEAEKPLKPEINIVEKCRLIYRYE